MGQNLWNYQLPSGYTFRYKPLLQGNQWVVALAHSGLSNNYVMWFDRNEKEFYGSFSSEAIGDANPPSFQSSAVGPNNVLYVMAGSGHLLAFNDTPSLLWKVQIAEVPPLTSMANGVPLVGVDGNIYVVSGYHKLVCISPQGVVLWRLGFESALSLFPREAEFTTISQADDGTLYLGSREAGSTTAYRAALLAVNPNGTLKWAYRPGVTSVCPPTAFPGGVAFGTYEGSIHAVSHAGAELWRKSFGDAIKSAPLYHSGRLWFTRYLFAVQSPPPPGITDKSPVTVLITDAAGSTMGSSRRVSWGGLMTPEPLKDGTVFVSTHRMASNGSVLRKFSEGQPTPTVASDGRIYLFNGSYTSQSKLECIYAGVQPPEKTRVIALSGSLSFGNIPAGTTSRKPMTIRNTGNTRMTVTSIDFPEGFQGDWDGGIIAAGGTQVVNVTFAPMDGRIYSGIVAVNSDKSSGSHTIAISGTGLKPNLVVEQPAGAAKSSGDFVSFGACARGFSSTPATTILVRNNGTGNLTITDLSLSGANAADFLMTRPKLPLVVAPNRSTTISLTFRPSSLGNKSAALAIASNDADQPVFMINLAGLGIDPDAEFPVGGTVNFALPADFTSLGQVLSVAGLPRGVSYQSLNASITGRPVAAGAFNAKVAIRGLDGKTSVHRMTILVEALPSWAVGSFTALIAPPNPATSALSGLGGCLKLTSTSTGLTTGSLQLGARRFGFRGQIDGQLASNRGSNPLYMSTVVITNTRNRTEDIFLSLQFLPEDLGSAPGLTGTMGFQGSELPIQPGWQHVWNARTKPAWAGKARALNVVMENTEITGPQGDGFAVIKLATSGVATWTGTLADGRPFTGSFTVSPDGDVPLYVPLAYPGGGCVTALLETRVANGLVRVDNPAEPNGRWGKLGSTSLTDRSYRDGFDVNLKIHGAQHATPVTGQLLFGFGAATPPYPMELEMSGAGVDTASAFSPFASGGVVGLDSQLRAGNVLAVVQSGLVVKITPSFSAATGNFGASVGISDLVAGKPLPRTMAMKGLYIPDHDAPTNSALRGYLLLPELPGAGQSATTTPIPSGKMSMAP